MENRCEEIRCRFPRIVLNLMMAVIFWIISTFVPPTIPRVDIPGIGATADFLVWIVAIMITAIFLVRALSDALVLGDVLTDIVVRRLGIKEKRSPRRAARDFIYIIITVLIAAAVSPIFATIEDVGHILTTATTYTSLGLIILLIYDIGRILHRIVEQKADLLANRLVKIAEKNRSSE